MSRRLLIDHSAWTRLHPDIIGEPRAMEVADMFEADSIATALPFRLEAGYSARNASEHERWMDQLSGYPSLEISPEVEKTAIETQRQLARVGHHRLPPTDLTIAALADHYGHGILHYDADYDLILEKTDLNYESVWLAPRGSL